MASISALSILGVRSFSTEEAEVIHFHKPLTVIVGANGCGKTTIIECLKYATTGQLPPGADHGKSFVHDLKLAGRGEVKAQIALKFKTRGSPDSIIATRSIQVATGRGGKLSFEALDGTIKMIESTAAGTREQRVMTFKPSSLDSTVPTLLDVPRAVLEHVIFCHQEDSNWPLQEGRVLKERFDQIFESTLYVKFLDECKSLRKDKAKELGEAATAATIADERLKKVRELKAQVKRNDQELEAMQKEHQDMSSGIQDLEEIVRSLEGERARVGKLRADARATDQMIVTQEHAIKSSEEQLARIPERAAIDALKRLSLPEFDARESTLSAHIGDVESRLNAAVSAQEEMRRRFMELTQKTEFMRNALDARNRAKRELDLAKNEMRQLADTAERDLMKHGFVKPIGDFSADQLQEVLVTCNSTVRTRLTELHTVKFAAVQAATDIDTKANKQHVEDTAAVKHARASLDEARAALRSAQAALDSKLRGASEVELSSEVRTAQRDVEASALAQKSAEEQLRHLAPSQRDAEARLKHANEEMERLRKEYRAAVDEMSAKAASGAALKQVETDEAEASKRYESIKGQVQAVLKMVPASVSVGNAVSSRVAELRAGASSTSQALEVDKADQQSADRQYQITIQSAASTLKRLRDHAMRWTDPMLGSLWSELGLDAHSGRANAWKSQTNWVEGGVVDHHNIESKGLAFYAPTQDMLPTERVLLNRIKDISDAIELHANEDSSAQSTIEEFLRDARDFLHSQHKCQFCDRAAEGPEETKVDEVLSRFLMELGSKKLLQETAARNNPIVTKLVNIGLSGDSKSVAWGQQQRQKFLEQAKAIRDVVKDFHATMAQLAGIDQKLLQSRQSKVTAAELVRKSGEACIEVNRNLEAAQAIQVAASEVSTFANKAQRTRADALSKFGAGNLSSNGADASARSTALHTALSRQEDASRVVSEEVSDIANRMQELNRKMTAAASQGTAATTAFSKAQALLTEITAMQDRVNEVKAKEGIAFERVATAEKKLAVSHPAAAEASAACKTLQREYDTERAEVDDAGRRLDERIKTLQSVVTRMRQANIDIRTADRNGAGATQQAMDAIATQASQVHDDIEVKASLAKSLQSDLQAQNAARASLAQLRALHMARQERDRLIAERDVQQQRVDAELGKLLLEDTFRQLYDEAGIDPSNGGVEIGGMGPGQQRDAPRKHKTGHVADLELEVVEEDGDVRGSGSKRRRTGMSADAAFDAVLASFTKKHSTALQDRARLGGRMDQTRMVKGEREKDLTSSILKDAHKEYTNAVADLAVLEDVVRDLDIEIKSMDSALMSFHSKKITEINTTISELWSLTYKGTDIENIEIHSDVAEENAGGAVPAGGRSTRSYNYRVVMTKCGTQMDMRGRCSAGQKVLASIIIRLALGENFSVNTGILALDEPTTNLDSPNRKGLAEALARIIEHRAKDTLQLIVITHDDEFVRELGRSTSSGGGSSSENHLGRYYKVSRKITSAGGSVSKVDPLQLSDYAYAGDGDADAE